MDFIRKHWTHCTPIFEHSFISWPNSNQTRCFRDLEGGWWNLQNVVVYIGWWTTMIQFYQCLNIFIGDTFYGLKFWDDWNNSLIIWCLDVPQILNISLTKPDKDKKSYLNKEIYRIHFLGWLKIINCNKIIIIIGILI